MSLIKLKVIILLKEKKHKNFIKIFIFIYLFKKNYLMKKKCSYIYGEMAFYLTFGTLKCVNN